MSGNGLRRMDFVLFLHVCRCKGFRGRGPAVHSTKRAFLGHSVPRTRQLMCMCMRLNNSQLFDRQGCDHSASSLPARASCGSGSMLQMHQTPFLQWR